MSATEDLDMKKTVPQQYQDPLQKQSTGKTKYWTKRQSQLRPDARFLCPK
jgi:hypothetical protein